MDIRSNSGCGWLWAPSDRSRRRNVPFMELRVRKGSLRCLAGAHGRFGISVCAGFSAVARVRWGLLEWSCRTDRLDRGPAFREEKLAFCWLLDRKGARALTGTVSLI